MPGAQRSSVPANRSWYRDRKLFACIGAAILAGLLWQRHASSQWTLAGNDYAFYAYEGRIYAARRNTGAGVLLAGSAGDPALQPIPGIHPQLDPFSVHFTTEGIFYLHGVPHSPDSELSVPREPWIMTEYVMHSPMGQARRAAGAGLSVQPFWPGMEAPRRALLRLQPWNGAPAQDAPLGIPNARPVGFAATPQTLYWLNARPMEMVTRQAEDGSLHTVGTRGRSQLIAISRRGGKARILAEDLKLAYGVGRIRILARGEDVYWMDGVSVGKGGQPVSRLASIRLCRYDAAAGRVRILALLPESFQFAPLALHGDRLIAIGAQRGEGREPNRQEPDAREMFCCNLDGADARRLPLPAAMPEGHAALLQSAGDALWGIDCNADGCVPYRVFAADAPRIAPLRSARLPRGARPFGITDGALYWTQTQQSENWLAWSGEALAVNYRTHIRSTRLD